VASPKQSTPSTHPSSDGLQSAIRDGVQNELEKRGMGGGGGGGDRLAALERSVAIIQATMVTRESMESELSKIRVEIAKLPVTLLKWLGGAIAVIASVAAAVWRAMN